MNKAVVFAGVLGVGVLSANLSPDQDDPDKMFGCKEQDHTRQLVAIMTTQGPQGFAQAYAQAEQQGYCNMFKGHILGPADLKSIHAPGGLVFDLHIALTIHGRLWTPIQRG